MFPKENTRPKFSPTEGRAGLYDIYRGFAGRSICEFLVNQARRMKSIYYNEYTLEDHRAYLSDEQPGRKSYAFAVADSYEGKIPTINLAYIKRNYLGMHDIIKVSRDVREIIELPRWSRQLFNVQEYYSDASAVPKHFDGELLDFEKLENGSLRINRAIRPREVAVLTLVNDVKEGGGTKIWLPDGTTEVVECKAGDLLVFNNAKCFHGTNDFKGQAQREDGILRMTIGWRSLSNNCFYYERSDNGGNEFCDMSEHPKVVNDMVQKWLKHEWPARWEELKATNKAAF